MDFVGKFILAGYASNFVKVVITGEGSDEFFGRYPWFKTIKNQNDTYTYRGQILQHFIENNESTEKGYDLTISNHDGKDQLIDQYRYYPISVDNIQEMERTTGMFSQTISLRIYITRIHVSYMKKIYLERSF